MLEHFRHHFFPDWKIDEETKEIYASLVIRAFALSMIGIFVPIYLIKLGFSIGDIILNYLLSYYAMMTVSIFLAAWVMKRFGIKHSIIFSIPFTIIHILLLYTIGSYGTSLILIGMLGGIGNALFWMGMHSDFSKSSGRHGVTNRASLYMSLPQMGSMIGPFLGGLIATVYDFELLFTISILFMLLSAIPLRKTKDFTSKTKHSLWKLLDVDRKYFLGFVSEGMRHVVEYFYLPIFIYMSITNLVEIGIVGTLLQLSVLLVPIVIAKVHHRIRLLFFLRTGAVFYVLLLLAVPYIDLSSKLFPTALILGVLTAMMNMPFYTLSVKESKKFEPVEWSMYRELGINVGRIVMIFVGLLAFNSVFPLAGISSLLYFLI